MPDDAERLAAPPSPQPSALPPGLPAAATAPAPSRPPWPRILGRPFAVLADRAAWGSLGYLLLSLVTGVFYFTWVVTGLSLSLGLGILVVGVPVFVAFVASVRILAQVEGVLVETLLGAALPRRSPAEPTPPLWIARIRSWLADRRTWASVVYLLLELPLGVAYFTLFTTLLTLSVSLLVFPLGQALLDIPIVTFPHREIWLPAWALPLASLAGLALLVGSMHLARAAGRLQAGLARRMLVRA